MITFNNTIKSHIVDIEIKGKTIKVGEGFKSVGIPNRDGTFKIVLLTTNGLQKSDKEYKECKQIINLPCELGSTLDLQVKDILKYDKENKTLIIDKFTNNGELLPQKIHYEVECVFNLISYNGKTTIDSENTDVKPIIKATVGKTLFTSNDFISDELSKVKQLSNKNANRLNKKVEYEELVNEIDKHTMTKADFIARNFLTTPLIVSNSEDSIYSASGINHPPLGAVFNSYDPNTNLIKNKDVSSNGNAWAIIIGHHFFKNTMDGDKRLEIQNKIRQISDFMIENVSVGRFNSMDFNFIDTNLKFNEKTNTWEKSNYKELYMSTMWLQVKALVYAYDILKDYKYLDVANEVLDSLFNIHFYINNKVATNELPSYLEWASYEFIACDNLTTSNRFVGSTRQYANQMGYYIIQAIRDYINYVGDKERTTAKGDSYRPSDILKGLKKYLKTAYETQNITSKPLGLPYGYFHRVEKTDGTYDYIPQNWDFIENTWGDGWFVGDVVTYTIYAFAGCGLTDIAREYANNYYKLKVDVKDVKWTNRFSQSELLFYDRVDFQTGTHLTNDDSISITYTSLFYEILKEIGLNNHIDSCVYTLAKRQIDSTNKNIDGGYAWDVSKDGVSLEFKSLGEIINSNFYKHINISSFSNIDSRLDEIIQSSEKKYLGKSEKAQSASVADSVEWNNVKNKPNTFTPSTHNHELVSVNINGFMSKEDKVKLNGIANNANNYVHPNDANNRHVSDSQIASWNAKPTVTDVDNKIKEVVGTAPEALNTLKEIGDALGNDANFAGTMTSQLAGKAPLVHNHNDIYYTKSENDNRYLGKASKAESSKVADSVAWNNVSGKPTSYVPSTHNHDDRYFTDAQSDVRYYRNDLGQVVDFNNAKVAGVYTISTSNTLPNAPCTGSMYGTLEVIPRGTDLVQRVTTSGGLMFYRYYGNDSLAWRNWIEVFNGSNKPTWNDITNKPTTFEPSNHNHDNRYYNVEQVNSKLNEKVNALDYSLTTITKNLNISTTWIDTGISGTDLATGSYMIQLSGMASSTGFWYEIFTGTMSWYSGSTNSTDTDEILLHKAGHASNNKAIYLRTVRQASGSMKLQIASSHALGASNYTFKFRNLI